VRKNFLGAGTIRPMRSRKESVIENRSTPKKRARKYAEKRVEKANESETSKRQSTQREKKNQSENKHLWAGKRVGREHSSIENTIRELKKKGARFWE